MVMVQYNVGSKSEMILFWYQVTILAFTQEIFF